MLNREMFEEAKKEYDSGNYSGALRGYYNCLKGQSTSFAPGEAGLLYHMLGNCLVKMRSYDDAVKAYKKALLDTDYGSLTAVHSNYGVALTTLGDFDGAIEQFNTALKDQSYETPYRLYNGLGSAYMQKGDLASAGTAFRNAAVDEQNPTPMKALLNLGVCFMGLGRPQDAVETYKAIFEFDPDEATLNKTYANLGQSYVAMGMYPEAVESFENALRDESYELSPAANSDYLKAREGKPSAQVDDGLRLIQGGNADDELDSTQSFDSISGRDDEVYGAGIPSADDTGFFTAVDEEEDEMQRLIDKKGRKGKHKGLRTALIILVVLIVLIGGGAILYWQGFGIPSQQSTIETLFAEHAEGKDTSNCWVGASDEEEQQKIAKIMNSVAETDDVTIDYLEQGMMNSTAIVTANLSDGGSLRYEVSLTRDFSGLISWTGWKINGIEFSFASAQNENSTSSTSSSSSSKSSTSTSTGTSTGTSSSGTSTGTSSSGTTGASGTSSTGTSSTGTTGTSTTTGTTAAAS